MYVFAIPNNVIDGGINHIAPTSAALGRSSATHFPARFLRHFLVIRSEMRPAIGTPTFRIDGEKYWRSSQIGFMDENAEAKREALRVGLTQVTNAGGYKTRPD